MGSSPYKVLEVAEDAPWSEIKESYRTLVRVWHPDRFQGDPLLQQKAEQKTKELNEAYKVLKDEQVTRGTTKWRGESADDEIEKIREELRKPFGTPFREKPRTPLGSLLKTIYWLWVGLWQPVRLLFSFRFVLGAVLVLMLMGRPANDRISGVTQIVARKVYATAQGVVRFVAKIRALEL